MFVAGSDRPAVEPSGFLGKQGDDPRATVVRHLGRSPIDKTSRTTKLRLVKGADCGRPEGENRFQRSWEKSPCAKLRGRDRND